MNYMFFKTYLGTEYDVGTPGFSPHAYIMCDKSLALPKPCSFTYTLGQELNQTLPKVHSSFKFCGHVPLSNLKSTSLFQTSAT